MTTQQLSSEEMLQIQDLNKTHQLLMATNLVKELISLDPNLAVDEMMMLDSLGCAGLSLTIGEDASRTYIELARLGK